MKKKFKQMGAFLVAMSVVAPQASMFREIDSIAVESNNIDQIITNEVEKEMDYITESNGNKAPRITLNDNNVVETIDATLSQDFITSSDDAMALIANINDLLGIDDVDQQLKFVSESESLYNVVYKFIQQYEGIEFVNSSVSIVVDKKTKKGKFLNSSFVPDFTIDTTPGITSDCAIQIVEKLYYVNITNTPELVVYTNEEKEHRLVWDLTTDSYAPSEVYVDAQNGDILYERMPYDANEENDELVDYSVSNHSLPKTFPEEFTVNIARDDENNDLYKLHDTERNIYILNKEVSIKDMKGFYENAKKENVIQDSYDNLNDYIDDLGVLYNVAMAYDFYNEINNNEIIKNNDDNDKESKPVLKALESLLESNLYVIPDLRKADGTPVNNAYAYTGSAEPYISFGTTYSGDKYGHLYDVVVHEYTHFVSDKTVGGWHYTGNGEPSSLSEAYSDIMGEYAEIMTEPSSVDHQWIHGTGRNLSDIGTLIYDEEEFSNIECHIGGTVIGHAAYLMEKKGIPDELALKIWYNSLDYLKSSKTFENCRIAVLKAADDVFNNSDESKEDIEKWKYDIKTAFNNVNVMDNTEVMGDINGNNKFDINDIDLLREYLNGDNTYINTYEKKYFSDLTFDGVVDESDLEAIVNMTIKIKEQPTDLYKKIGEDIELSVTAESMMGEELEYRWYCAQPGSDEFRDTGVIGVYSLRMSDSVKERKFYCEISDESGNKTKTDAFTLYELCDLKIIQQPTDSLVKAGEKAKISVVAEGNDLKYTWYYRVESYDMFCELMQSKTHEYTLNMRRGHEDIKMYCKITDRFGNEVKSDIVTLGVRDIIITKQPTDQYANPGDEIKLSVEAEGEDLEYRWYHAEPGSDEFTNSGVRGVYILRMSEGANGRRLYCKISDAKGNVVKSDIVTLRIPDIKITKQPTDQYANPGDEIKLSVEAEGEDLEYKWYHAAPGSDEFIDCGVKGLYIVRMSEGANGRRLYCEISDAYGNVVKSDVVTLYIYEIKITKQPTDQYKNPGEEIKLSVEAEGDELQYKWFHAEPGSDEFIDCGVKGVYITRMSDSHNGRRLYCEISDAYGNVVKSNVVTLYTKDIKITKQPTDQYAKPGEEIKIFAEAQGKDLEYRWYHAEPGSDEFTNSGVRGVYIVRMSDSHNGRRLYCEISDAYGNVVKSDVVTLHTSDIKITKQPTDQYAKPGEEIKVFVEAEGEDLEYKWYHAQPGSDEFTNSGVRGVYIVRMSDSHNGRRLYCEITDKSGAKIKSDVVTLYKVTVPGQNGSEKNYGDANQDGKVLLNDAVLILQYLGNPDAYPLSDEAKANADVSGNGDGITNKDALAIQRFVLHLIPSLPES